MNSKKIKGHIQILIDQQEAEIAKTERKYRKLHPRGLPWNEWKHFSIRPYLGDRTPAKLNNSVGIFKMKRIALLPLRMPIKLREMVADRRLI